MAAIRCVSCDGPLRRNHAGGGYTHLAPGSATLIDEFLDQDHPPSPVPQVLQRFAFLATAAGVDTQPTPDDLRRRHLRALRMAATG
jgi:hypothetical protein